MGEFEALGDAVTGSIVARAVEPRSGEDSDGHTQEANCLNCGCELQGEYCHCCGQHAHVHRTLSAFFHDFLHGVLHFEGKVWRTLPMLAWKPGEMTRRYIAGQRTRFVSPLALFLFSVFLMFAVLGFAGTTIVPTGGAVREGMENSADAQQRVIDRLERERAVAANKGAPTEAMDRRLASLREELNLTRTIADRGIVSGTATRISDDVPNWLREPIQKGGKNPELLFYKLKTNAYKYSWALIPVSVPLLWLLFPFSRRFGLYDHAVFVTYSLCFMMLLLVAGTLIGLVSGRVASFAWFVPPIHMYRQLRGAYGVGRWGAVWRTFALTIFAFMAISLFASLLFAIGAFD